MLFICVFCAVLTACNEHRHAVSTIVIPTPNDIEAQGGESFRFSDDTSVVLSNQNDKYLNFLANELVDFILLETPYSLNVVDDNNAIKSSVHLIIDNTFDGAESYQLVVNKQRIEITSGSNKGLFYGLQTLKQLILGSKETNEISAMVIDDNPRFSYRGLMLDVSRHFFTVDEIKKTIDLMAMYKFNTLHWHLTDDQGWRIDIKQYPLLTSIGSYRFETQVDKNFNPFLGDGIPHFGYYSQDDIRDVVNYASQRQISIIPEIDMPGHMQAALAAYPNLGCTAGPFSVSTRWGVHNDILCPSEFTFNFIENVLLEVVNLFPYEYIHIGGDEVPTTRWKKSSVAQNVIIENSLASEHELQGYFYQRISSFLKQHNRKTIGWDEIQEKGLTDKTTIMVWRGLEQGEQAIKNGHDVILNPASHTYLNYYQDSPELEPLAQCCLVTLEQVYIFNPSYDHLSDNENHHILGAQGSLWTEYISTQKHLEYMMMPRIIALSEVLWTNDNLKNYALFEDKLPFHFKYLEKIDVNYRPR